MPLSPLQQIIKTIETKKHILITAKTNPSGDAIASVLAFYLIAKRLGKKASIAIDSHHFNINPAYNFLPEYCAIKTSVTPSKDMVLEFNIPENGINGLTYKIKGTKLLIRIFPNQSGFSIGPPKIKQEQYPYDLIAVLDSCDLESLGRVYDEHTEFFYHTPILNIDHHPENEHFGEVNLVELPAVSTTEILFTLAEAMDKKLLDEKVSTCLLTGIIHESRSFQSESITPRTLAMASELMSLGAKRELIIQKLFYNKAVGALQLWGRILAKLKTEEDSELAFSSITENDFEETGTSEQDLLDITENLIMHAPQAKIVALLNQKDEGFHLIIHTHKPSIDLRRIFYNMSARGSRNLVECRHFSKNADDVIQEIKTALSKSANQE